MRKIIAGLFITLDGVVEAPQKWNPPYYDDEMSQAVMVPLAAAGAHLYGRPLTLIQARAHQNGIVALRYTLGHGTAAPTLAEVSPCVS
jgi:hypothetical protein